MTSPTSTVYLNGAFLPKGEATVSIEDRGFMFGDGVYEVWRVLHGRLFEHGRHVARLRRGLSELRIDPPAEVDAARLAAIADRLIADNGIGDGQALLYLEITRGPAPRIHQFPPGGSRATIVMMVTPFVPLDALQTSGATAVRVPDIRWHRCDVKTVQLLPNVLAQQQAAEHGAYEAIFVRDGVITEASRSNVMGVIDGELRTHPADAHILRGITRDVVLELARDAGLRVVERALPDSALVRVDELFLT
ncbi:MAG TPA: aminotransferase class IV, partial [Gemmatimonadaceae bacterium]|nr:aminotransferase class IV [Gemmatimonadaceae bacterium]